VIFVLGDLVLVTKCEWITGRWYITFRNYNITNYGWDSNTKVSVL